MFLDGELPQEQQQQVLDHLHECLECYHAYDFQAELKQIIAAKCANEPLPPGLLDRIKQTIRVRRSLCPPTHPAKCPRFGRVPGVVAANIWFWWIAVILTIVSVLTVIALVVGYLKNVTALKYPSRMHQQLE